MAKFTLINDAPGARGVGDVLVEAGATLEGVELTTEQVAQVKRFGHLKIKGGALDHDENGKAGGSKPADPPALTGKNKAELLQIAKDEGVDVADDATNPQIVEAIEAKRAA